MAPITSTEPASLGVRDVNRCGRETTGRKSPSINEDMPSNMRDASTINNKIDFFRFMGLEIKKVCDLGLDANTNDNHSANDDNNNNNDEFCYPKTSPDLPPCKPSDNKKRCFEHADKFGLKSKEKRQKINKVRSQSSDMVDCKKKIVASIRECRVMIIGEKCRVCGKSFKCIKDVQLHMRKKHRMKKQRRTKIVLLKIGNEVISRVSIREKHLKRHLYRKEEEEEEDDRPTLIATSENTSENTMEESWNDEEITRKNRLNDEESSTPLVDLDVCDIPATDTDSDSTRIIDRDLLLSPLGNRDNAGSSNRYENDEDDEIKEVLRITRPTNRGETINHETPNRMERELLLSDAIRELVRIDNDMIDPMDMIKFVDDDKTLDNDNNDIIDDYCWINNKNAPNHHLDVIESNCSYHIQNDCEFDFSLGRDNSLAGVYSEKYFNHDNTCIDSREYRNKNGDVIPYFIDYAQCLDNNSVLLNNNNNDTKKSDDTVYDLEDTFYNEARIDGWNKLANVANTFNCNIGQRTGRGVDTSVLIKEEIMLDDLS